jgi:hypothetical protein
MSVSNFLIRRRHFGFPALQLSCEVLSHFPATPSIALISILASMSIIQVTLYCVLRFLRVHHYSVDFLLYLSTSS